MAKMAWIEKKKNTKVNIMEHEEIAKKMCTEKKMVK